MKCEDIQQLLTGYLLHDLDKSASNIVKSHLAECAGCQASVRKLELTLDLVQDALAATQTAPKRLAGPYRARIMAAREVPVVHWLFSSHPSLARAAAVLVVGLFVFAFLVPSMLKSRIGAALDMTVLRERLPESAQKHDGGSFGYSYSATDGESEPDDSFGDESLEEITEVIDELPPSVDEPGEKMLSPVEPLLQRVPGGGNAPYRTEAHGGIGGGGSGTKEKYRKQADEDWYTAALTTGQDKQEGERPKVRRPTTTLNWETSRRNQSGKKEGGFLHSPDNTPIDIVDQRRAHDTFYTTRSRESKKSEVAAGPPLVRALNGSLPSEHIVDFDDSDSKDIGGMVNLNSLPRRAEPQPVKKRNYGWDERTKKKAVYYERSLSKIAADSPAETPMPAPPAKAPALGDIPLTDKLFGPGRGKRDPKKQLEKSSGDGRTSWSRYSLPLDAKSGLATLESGSGQYSVSSPKGGRMVSKGLKASRKGDEIDRLLDGSETKSEGESLPDASTLLRLERQDTSESGERLLRDGKPGGETALNEHDEKDMHIKSATEKRVLEDIEEEEHRRDAEPTDPLLKAVGVNPFVYTEANAFSTFGIDVDTASFTLARNYMKRGYLPPAESVRTEEFVNFFDYGYAPPKKKTFAVYTDCAPTPFGRGLHLLKIGVKGRRLGREEERQSVLTIAIDTSGSMSAPDRFGLVNSSLRMLLDELDPKDTVAIVQYDSVARMVLDHTPASNKKQILAVIEGLQTSGPTNLEKGLQKAYAVAHKGFVPGAANRVLLLSDGVANLGSGKARQILDGVEKFRTQGIFCSVFGFGIGMYDDAMLEQLADKGNGSYAFIDSLAEAKRIFVDDLSATLNLIASDVKIQVEWNPEYVTRYRQLGYENRQLTKQQFRDDAVDAGEVGSGQSVTALYELKFTGKEAQRGNDTVAIVRVRYRRIDTGEIEEIEHAVHRNEVTPRFSETPPHFKLAAAAAEFAEILRGSEFAKGSTFNDVSKVLGPVSMELALDKRMKEAFDMTRAARGLPRGK